MDADGYKERIPCPGERNVGGTHGLMLIFFLLEHPHTYTPALAIAFGSSIAFAMGGGIMTYILMSIFAPITLIFCLTMTLWVTSRSQDPDAPCDWEEVLECTDAKMMKAYKGRKIPIETFYEAYMNKKMNFKEGVNPLTVFWQRYKYFRMCFTAGHMKFFLTKLIPQMVNHTEAADAVEVKDVYDRGNDFYRWFLGPRMIYTSGIFESPDDTLEEAQDRKLDLVCRQSLMKPGQKHLDIGCGWGTMVAHAAKYYGTISTGVTLAAEQRKWGLDQAKDMGVADRVDILCMDYREIPKQQFDVITCLEMAEHVGIQNFQTFLLQVKDMLTDDGMFYLQIAGLRRAWQFEDLIWGLFMGTYVFPAADASCPLGFVTSQCERAGFEIHRVENCGVHYGITINKWFTNWMSNEKAIVEKYGEWWFRCWVIFLGWSTIVATQGSSTVFLVSMHKNFSKFERRDNFVGEHVIGTQQ